MSENHIIHIYLSLEDFLAGGCNLEGLVVGAGEVPIFGEVPMFESSAGTDVVVVFLPSPSSAGTEDVSVFLPKLSNAGVVDVPRPLVAG